MNAPPSRAILMAMVVRRCNAEHIAKCSMTRASPEATGRRHWATYHSVLPAGCQGDNQLNDDATCTHCMDRFDGNCDAAVLYHMHPQWSRFVAFIKATKRHHRTSDRSDITQLDTPAPVVSDIHREKELQLTCWPLITIEV